MDIQDFLTYAIEAIACGFIAFILLDLGDRISNEILDIVYPVTTTPLATAQKTSVPAPQLELVQQLEMFQLPVIEDPWLTAEVNSITCCCRPCATPPTKKPHLLLPPVLEIPNQYDLAAMPSTELRKLCSERGIKWRNAHQNKHLTKAEMLTALTT